MFNLSQCVTAKVAKLLSWLLLIYMYKGEKGMKETNNNYN